jgi:hypothetical protein
MNKKMTSGPRLVKTVLILSVLAMLSVPLYGQTLTASPDITSGCVGQTITYTFSYTGSGTIVGIDWDISGGTVTVTGTFSRTVSWNTSGTVKTTAGERLSDGTIVTRTNEKSFTAFFTGGTASGPNTVCYNGSGTLTLSGNSAGAITWQRCVSGCSTTTDDGWSTNADGNTFSNLTATTSFRAKVTSASCGAKYSTSKTVVVEPDLSHVTVLVPNPFPRCATSNLSNITFMAVNGHTGGNPQYTWYRSSLGPDPVSDNENNSDPTIYDPYYPLQEGDVIYCKVSFSYNCTVNNPVESNHVTVELTEPQTPSLNFPPVGDGIFCQGESVTFSASSAQTITGYAWSINSSYTLATTPTFTIVAGQDFQTNDQIKLTVNVTGPCLSINTMTATTSNMNVIPVPTLTANADTGTDGCPGGESDFSFSLSKPSELNSYSWSVSPASAGSVSQAGTVTWSPSGFTGNATVKVAATVCSNLQRSDEVIVTVHPRPSTLGEANLAYCDFEPISLAVPGWTNSFRWYDQQNNLLMAGNDYVVPCKKAGSYTYLAENVDGYGCVSATKFPIHVSVTSSCDQKLNYIESISYDAEETVVGHQKSYFDEAGKLLQSQVKNLTNNQVLSSKGIEDKYDRQVMSTLGAPLNQTSFQYKHWFALNQSGELYNYDDFGQPLSAAPGTVGAYYGNGNTLEDHVPVTDYPFSTVEYYNDGTGEVKYSAGPGEIHRMGAGHEVLSGTFPVYNELQDYLSKRSLAAPGNFHDGSLKNEGVINVIRDQNGKYSISITDKEGRNVFSARQGLPADTAHVLSVTNTVISSGNPESADYRPMTYFFILNDQAVTIIGSTDFIVENIVTDERKASGVTFAAQDGKWPAGFYRLLLNNTASEVTITYTNYFQDVSYQFYDAAGRLRSSVSPNGYKKWTSPLTYHAIDKTRYIYNYRGWLLQMIEPDAGTTNYQYRKDGKIRFSQNAQQAVDSSFSYTHYDPLGRPVESGEYVGKQYTYSTLSGQLEYSSQVPFLQDIKDWVKTYYDYADTDFYTATHLPNTYTQNFVRGGVSKTENANIQTWYSYDELGRVTWMTQKPKMLPRVFVVKYTYDFLGNVLTVANLSYDLNGNVVSQFYHHYEYDADKRLSKAYTSLEETGSMKLRATYSYYLHGPLKRIELGDNLQGIDFVYNIQGWLTQINHPDPTQDPGGDTNDAFGMVLDYYESDLANLFTASTGSAHDPAKIHGLPANLLATVTDEHQPLIHFMPEQTSEDALSMKAYSAGNPQYQKMITEIKNK